MRPILIAASVALVCSLVGTPLLIRYFRQHGFGQIVREGENMPAHGEKAGTPTMGGAAIVFAAVAGYLAARVVGIPLTPTGILVVATFVAMAGVGFVDDFIKVRMNRSLGLTKTAKFGGQALVAVAFAFLGPQLAGVSQRLSFVAEVGDPLPGIAFYLLVFLMLTGTTNSVNLTDGLDGLAGGAATLAFGAYVLVAFWQFRNPNFYGVEELAAQDLAVLAAAAVGACAGFLWWNAPPAQIFMGDTGSLAIGGLLAALALATHTQFLLIAIGGLFVVITMSVILQVFFFRLFGRRVFRMAPLQHHFEMRGWHETTIVVRFWIIAGIGIAVGLGAFYGDFLARGGIGG